jgi:hypothetical protein
MQLRSDGAQPLVALAHLGQQGRVRDCQPVSSVSAAISRYFLDNESSVKAASVKAVNAYAPRIVLERQLILFRQMGYPQNKGA